MYFVLSGGNRLKGKGNNRRSSGKEIDGIALPMWPEIECRL